VNGLTVFDHLNLIRINLNSGAFAYCQLPIANGLVAGYWLLVATFFMTCLLPIACCQLPVGYGIVTGNDCIKKYRKTQAGQ